MSDVAEHLDALRIALGEVNVLAAVTAATYDGTDWNKSDPDVVDGIATLLGLISKSATAALTAFHRLHGAVADAAPAPAGERWDYSNGTASGDEPASEASGDAPAAATHDAEIVRRLRARCPDNRFDHHSDVELIRLFRWAEQLLNRSEDDVIAAITHPRSAAGSFRHDRNLPPRPRGK